MITQARDIHTSIHLHGAHIKHWTPRLERLRRNFDLLLHEGEGERAKELIDEIERMLRAKRRLVLVLSRHHMRQYDRRS